MAHFNVGASGGHSGWAQSGLYSFLITSVGLTDLLDWRHLTLIVPHQPFVNGPNLDWSLPSLGPSPLSIENPSTHPKKRHLHDAEIFAAALPILIFIFCITQRQKNGEHKKLEAFSCCLRILWHWTNLTANESSPLKFLDPENGLGLPCPGPPKIQTGWFKSIEDFTSKALEKENLEWSTIQHWCVRFNGSENEGTLLEYTLYRITYA